MTAPLRALDARDFPALARRNGITQSATSLIVSGRLLPLQVGRRTYYGWGELLTVMPGWARRRQAVLGGVGTVLLGGGR